MSDPTKAMSDQFWLSFGVLCGSAVANAPRDSRGNKGLVHVELVMKELLETFPDYMWPLERYLK